MFRRKPKGPKIRFDMKVTFEYGQGISTYTYQTDVETADKALSSIFTEIGGEKVVCISSRQEGKSIIFPRDKLISAESLFVEVVEENKE